MTKFLHIWKMGLHEAESINFKYTTMSLNSVYETGLKHAIENIRRNGGKVDGDNISIKKQAPLAVKFEKSFAGLYPLKKISVTQSAQKAVANNN